MDEGVVLVSLTETASRNLRAELARRGKTAEDLAAAWGYEIRTANNRLKGRTPLSTDEIEKAAGLFGLDPENLTMLLIQPIDSIKQFKA